MRIPDKIFGAQMIAQSVSVQPLKAHSVSQSLDI